MDCHKQNGNNEQTRSQPVLCVCFSLPLAVCLAGLVPAAPYPYPLSSSPPPETVTCDTFSLSNVSNVIKHVTVRIYHTYMHHMQATWLRSSMFRGPPPPVVFLRLQQGMRRGPPPGVPCACCGTHEWVRFGLWVHAYNVDFEDWQWNIVWVCLDCFYSCRECSAGGA